MKISLNTISVYIIATFAAALIGCTPTHSFDVSVLNHSNGAITLWLCKDGPPAEEYWLSPEQLEHLPRDIRYDLANVLPGKTGYTGEVTGTFDKGTHAILRVYPGNFDLVEILKEKPVPTSIMLVPGKNDFVAVDEAGKLAVKHTESPRQE